MNKRIQKKVQKSLKNRIKTKKLHVEPNDTIVVNIDFGKECFSDIYNLFNAIKEFFDKYDCKCVMLDKHIDINILDKEYIQSLKDIIAEWETQHD